MVELIAQGVKTDKGFKEVHLNQVARTVSDHYGFEISGTQVYNHLCKWRTRWVRITRLKDINGALWDDRLSMIVLDEEHYMLHIKDHVKDAEYLNVPLENYTQMAIIFGNGQATGRFAMGSNEALGTLLTWLTVVLDLMMGLLGMVLLLDQVVLVLKVVVHLLELVELGLLVMNQPEDLTQIRREREPRLWMKQYSATTRTEVHPDMENSVMDLPGFSVDQLDLVLTHLTKDKVESLVYIQKNEARRARWVKKFLEEHHPESI
uniref:Myb/SANT-like domain-containing protein n=1 Tax=Oryza punctata TaxID=4537 RepID=A0A0E0KCK2_ORYPU